MKYAIIGSGKIGTALARTFARKNIEVGIANSPVNSKIFWELRNAASGIHWIQIGAKLADAE